MFYSQICICFFSLLRNLNENPIFQDEMKEVEMRKLSLHWLSSLVSWLHKSNKWTTSIKWSVHWALLSAQSGVQVQVKCILSKWSKVPFNPANCVARSPGKKMKTFFKRMFQNQNSQNFLKIADSLKLRLRNIKRDLEMFICKDEEFWLDFWRRRKTLWTESHHWL